MINGKYSVSGAQPSKVLKKVIEKALQEEKMLECVEDENLGDRVCNSDGCGIVNKK